MTRASICPAVTFSLPTVRTTLSGSGLASGLAAGAPAGAPAGGAAVLAALALVFCEDA